MDMSQSLYFTNLDNNKGVLQSAVDQAEDEENKEALLAYFFTLVSKEPIDQDKLDAKIEQWVSDTFQVDVDFEVDDGLDKLEKMNLLEKDGEILKVKSIDEAKEILDYEWDNYYQWNTDDDDDAGAAATPAAPAAAATADLLSDAAWEKRGSAKWEALPDGFRVADGGSGDATLALKGNSALKDFHLRCHFSIESGGMKFILRNSASQSGFPVALAGVKQGQGLKVDQPYQMSLLVEGDAVQCKVTGYANNEFEGIGEHAANPGSVLIKLDPGAVVRFIGMSITTL
jgi:hypothetical protein